jgi:predicted flap endonuclease-1-like 5' DNA nuclease
MADGPRREDQPLAAIYGVGEDRADQLQDSGFNTAVDIAEATADEVSEAVDDIGVKQAGEFIEAAQSMLEYWPE